MAAACLCVMQLDKSTLARHVLPTRSHINVGSGADCTIRDLAELIAKVTGYDGKLRFDASKPDGTPRKLLDVSLLTKLGWTASIPLEQGLRETYQWFASNYPTKNSP